MIQWIGIGLLVLAGLFVLLVGSLLYTYLSTAVKTRAFIDTIDNYFNLKQFKTKENGKKSENL